MTGRLRKPECGSPVILPELIQGAWTSVMVLTYGANLAFFETHLLRQLSQVALRVVLADGAQLDSTLQSAAAGGQRLGQANRTYLAAPIRHSHAAHAKAVLMTTATEGRLLVGSGNLGQEGYAAPGDLWHVYAYNDEHTEHLEEFAAVRSLIDTAAARGLLDPPAVDLVAQVWNETPWLPASHRGPSTVRHNHDVALIDQLQDASAALTGAVRTLTVHAPFYDPDVAALGELITRLRPQRVRVLLTRNTSVDPITLQATLSGLGKHAELYEIAVTGDSATYIHAKWLHFIAGREELLLTGSANLSRSALLTTSPNGNIEIGVLQQRGPGGFEDLYAPLTLTPIDDLAALGLGFQSPEASHAAGATLIWSQLDGNRLRLVFVGDFDETTVSITGPDGSDISASSLARNGDAVTLLLTAADAELLAAGGPITVSVAAGDGEPGEQRASWPYQLRHLTERLRTVGRNRMLSRTGALPDTDKDLYELLTHLEQTLITDPVSAWKVVHPSVPVRAVEPDGESISWQDIDWDRLKRSPRYAAYHYAGRARVNPTDIEVILASISAQLNPQQPSGETGQRDSDEAEDAELGNESAEVGADPESAEEREAGEADDDEALRPRHLSVSTRTRMAFGRFVARYTNALANSDFVDMLGPTLTVHNAVIMHHLLRKLGERDGIDPLKAARAYLASWRLLWGSQQSPGLVAGLDSDERAAAEAVMAQGHLRAMTLQALVYPWFDALVRQDLGDELRDEAQYLCTDPTFALDAAVVHAAAPLPGQAVQLLDDLRTVAAHLGEEEVIGFVLRPFDLPASAAHWEWRRVRLQAADDRPAHDSDVRVLEVRDTIPGLTTQAAVAALARLAVATHLNDEDLEYWRIRFGDTHDMCFWDEHASSGICCVADDDSDLTELDVPWPDWWLRLEQIQADLAETVAA